MTIVDVRQTLLDGVAVADALQLRYAVVGGLAVVVWAGPRATKDVDLYIEFSDDQRQPLEDELRRRGFDVPAMLEELRVFGMFRSRSPSGVFLDIFSTEGPLGEAIISRRRQALFHGQPLWFVAPEELLLLKVFSDRPRDALDASRLVKRLGAALDVEYIDGWVRRLDESVGTDEVSQRFRAAVAEAKR